MPGISRLRARRSWPCNSSRQRCLRSPERSCWPGPADRLPWGPMVLTTVFDIVFAAGIGVASLALAGAVLRFLPRSALIGLAALELGSALAAWLAFALSHDHARELAVAAGGLTGCLIATSAALLLQGALARSAAMDANLEEAQTTLRA